MNPDLLNWLDNNKMCFNIIDEDVIEITGFGKMYYEDTSMIKSIFRTDADNNIKFNTMENIQTLQEEGINYIVFQFGDNWYYYDTRKDFEFQILKYVGNRKPLNHTQEFVNLGIHTPFELLNGSFSLTDWIKKAKYLGQSALGICDYNTMAATLILQKECEAAGIQWVFGYSLTFTDGIEKIDAKIYCQSQEGLQNLLRIQKCINVDSENKIIDLQDLLKHGAGNIIVFSKYASFWLKEIGNNLDRFFDSFDDCFYQLDLSEFKAERIDIKVLDATKCLGFEISEKDIPEDLRNKHYFWSQQQIAISGIGAIDYKRIYDNSEAKPQIKGKASWALLKNIQDPDYDGKRVAICANIVDIEEKKFKDKKTGENRVFCKLLLQQNNDLVEMVIWNDEWMNVRATLCKGGSLSSAKNKMLICSAQVKYSDYTGGNNLQLYKSSIIDIL